MCREAMFFRSLHAPPYHEAPLLGLGPIDVTRVVYGLELGADAVARYAARLHRRSTTRRPEGQLEPRGILGP